MATKDRSSFRGEDGAPQRVMLKRAFRVIVVVSFLLLQYACTQQRHGTSEDITASVVQSSIRFLPSSDHFRGDCSFQITLRNSSARTIRLCTDPRHFTAKAWVAGAAVDLFSVASDFEAHKETIVALKPGDSYSGVSTFKWSKVSVPDTTLAIVGVYDSAAYSVSQIADHNDSWTGVVFSNRFNLSGNPDEDEGPEGLNAIELSIPRTDKPGLAPVILHLELPKDFALLHGEPSALQVRRTKIEIELSKSTSTQRSEELRKETEQLNVPIDDRQKKTRTWYKAVMTETGWTGFRSLLRHYGNHSRSEIEYNLWSSRWKLVVRASSPEDFSDFSDELHALVVKLAESIDRTGSSK